MVPIVRHGDIELYKRKLAQRAVEKQAQRSTNSLATIKKFCLRQRTTPPDTQDNGGHFVNYIKRLALDGGPERARFTLDLVSCLLNIDYYWFAIDLHDGGLRWRGRSSGLRRSQR